MNQVLYKPEYNLTTYFSNKKIREKKPLLTKLIMSFRAEGYFS
jgi:hypothetical protein